MPNHLANETSPYLLQHADNPVDWHAWGEEALTLAREQNKPILLSIGYSACHWCHVMAHESFEDPKIAAIMNRHFVNIKVDREERPDIDQIYQTAQYLLTQRSGGWPLTMFLMPDQTPFYGGTYFPKTARYNLPAFGELLENIADAYHTKKHEIDIQNDALLERLEHNARSFPAEPHKLTDTPLINAAAAFSDAFDPLHGGIGDAPKFPHPTELEFCLRRYAATQDESLRHIALVSLEKMALGGIYDQLGGGFCRYSVDQQWAIPHFEKMLYDNGPLLRLYTDAWLVSANALFKRIVEETASWVMREMQSPEGGYYSSFDADSEGKEGKFYVWSPHQVEALLSTEEYAVVELHYGLDRAPNFESRHWHFIVSQNISVVANKLGKSVEACETALHSARQKLFAERAKRVAPGRDEKVLVSWNALMIKGMAHAARVFDRNDWLESAQCALDFIRSNMWVTLQNSQQRRLLATYKDRRAHLNAYLDDYAYLLDALIELMQVQFRDADLSFAQEIADVLLSQFEDVENGGFYFTSHDHEKLLLRPKPGFDSATPSGNGIAAFALQRLGHLLGEPRYLKSSERGLKAFFRGMMDQAGGFSSMCVALEEALVPPQIVILRGDKSALSAWQKEIDQQYRPNTIVLSLPSDLKNLPATFDKEVKVKANVNAWVCQGVTCLPPIDNLERLIEVCNEKNIG
jgi:uncharacterized protein